MIATNGKGEAAMQDGLLRGRVRVLEVAARQHGLLRALKGDGAEFLPVADQGVLLEDLVDRELSL